MEMQVYCTLNVASPDPSGRIMPCAQQWILCATNFQPETEQIMKENAGNNLGM
jgi:hypothetical protein